MCSSCHCSVTHDTTLHTYEVPSYIVASLSKTFFSHFSKGIHTELSLLQGNHTLSHLPLFYILLLSRG